MSKEMHWFLLFLQLVCIISKLSADNSYVVTEDYDQDVGIYGLTASLHDDKELELRLDQLEDYLKVESSKKYQISTDTDHGEG